MREIKFRAWDKENKIMIYSDEKCDEVAFIVENNGLQFYYLDTNRYLIDTCSIKMQYAGIKDKVGTEIYEGDILKDEENFLWVVTWEYGGFFIYNVHVITDEPALRDIYEDVEESFEVVGNIYEHPELLEEVGE